MLRTPLPLFLSSGFLLLAAILWMPAASRTVSAATTYSCPGGLTVVDGATPVSNQGVFGSKCYAFFNVNGTFNFAKPECEEMGGTLPVIESAGENAFVRSIAGSNEVWLGASDDGGRISGASEGNFYWVGAGSAFWTGGASGSAVGGAYENWSDSEPNDSGGNEDCAVLQTSDTWNDVSCIDGSRIVCEVPAVATVSLEPGGGGNAAWLIQLRQRNGLDERGNPLPSSSSSSVTSSASAVPEQSPNASSASSVSSSSSSSASVQPAAESEVPEPSSMQTRVCRRVMKRIVADAGMLARLNARLLKTFGFECGK